MATDSTARLSKGAEKDLTSRLPPRSDTLSAKPSSAAGPAAVYTIKGVPDSTPGSTASARAPQSTAASAGLVARSARTIAAGSRPSTTLGLASGPDHQIVQ